MLELLVKRTPWRDASALSIACLLLAGHLHSRLYLSEITHWDARIYYKMAETVALEPVEAPYAYRWLPHKLIPLVPLPAKRAYELVTWVSLLGASFLLCRLLARSMLPHDYVIAIVILGFLWAQWGGRFYVWYRAATEPVAYLLLVAGFCLAHAGRLVRLTGIMLVSALCREQSVLLLPYYYLLHYGLRFDRKGIVQSCAAAVPVAFLFVTVRVATPASGDYSMFHAVTIHLSSKLCSLSGAAAVAACFLTHGGLTVPVLLVFYRNTLRRLKDSPHITFYISANLALGLVAGTDTDRLMFYAFPAELYLVCLVLRDAGIEVGGRWSPFLITMSLGQIVISCTFAQQTRPANVFIVWNLVSCCLWSALLIGGRLWASAGVARADRR